MSWKVEQSFRTKWDNWKKLLAELVEKSGGGARLICPTSRELKVVHRQHALEVTLPYPICFFAVPEKKKSEEKRGASRSLAIFVDGHFALDHANQGHLKDIGSSATFFEICHDGVSAKKRLGLVDSYHFDFFSEDIAAAAPHPVFHAQRGIRLNDTFPKFKECLGKDSASRNVDIVEPEQTEKNALFKLGSFRIPTPQMDILNLGAAIAANQLVGSDNQAQRTVFGRLLKDIHGPDDLLHLAIQPFGHNTAVFDSPRRHLSAWFSTH